MAAIDFDGLFDRIGRIGHLAYVLAGDQAAVPAAVQDIFDEYEATADADLIGFLLSQQTQIPAPVVSPASAVSSLASSTLLRMVRASVPSISGTSAAVVELIRQMKAAGTPESVDQCTVSASAAALSSNVGDGVVVLSTKRGDGLVQENLFAEVLRLAVTRDSFTGGATTGREPVQLTGQPQTAGLWDHNYPTGSSASASASAVSASQDASTSGNLLTNGDAESWTSDPTPELNNWVMSGVWGTDMERSSTPYQGVYSLALLEGTTANIYQQFGAAGGTTATPVALTAYAVNFFAREVAGTVSGGILTVELVDDLGVVINDEQGVANSFTLTLSSLSTSWAAANGVFRIPEEPPDVMRLRFRVSTALAGDDVLIDSVCLARLTPAYAGGFSLAVFSGTTPFVVGDGWDVTAANNRSGENYLGTFQALFDRLFGMRGLNLLLPSSGTPTQPDTKITS
jgi:hypothetical protein